MVFTGQFANKTNSWSVKLQTSQIAENV